MSTYFANIIRAIRDQIRGDSRGFTLIELLIAMTLFAIFMAVTVGVFVRGLRTERAIVSFVEVNNNASLALEQMAREMRVGSNFTSVSPSEVDFINAQGHEVGYRLDNGSLERGEADSGGNRVYEALTAPTIAVERFAVRLFGGPPDNQYPTRVTIALTVASTNPYLAGVTTNVETTVSSRAE